MKIRVKYTFQLTPQKNMLSMLNTNKLCDKYIDYRISLNKKTRYISFLDNRPWNQFHRCRVRRRVVTYHLPKALI